MKRELITSVFMTIVTTVLLGMIYPLVVAGLAQTFFPYEANGQLIYRSGTLIGSRIIGQPFRGSGYFHSRPSAAGPAGYDAANSAATNYGPTNKKLIERVAIDAATLATENPNKPIPVDLATTSASGLDPDISPAGAEFQLPRVAHTRGIDEAGLLKLIREHTKQRQLDFLAEPRVNVLELNLALDERFPMRPPIPVQ